jgi:hypothetical protein
MEDREEDRCGLLEYFFVRYQKSVKNRVRCQRTHKEKERPDNYNRECSQCTHAH